MSLTPVMESRAVDMSLTSKMENRVKILILDPAEEERYRLSTLLQSNGYQTFAAASPGEAMEIIVRESPQVAFTEIFFPDMDASSILKSLRKLSYDMTIIIFTEQRERRNGNTRRLEHIFEFIEKPSTGFEIIGHLKRAIAFHREKKSLKSFIVETKERIRQQLEWLIWTQSSIIADRIQYSSSIVDSIKHTATQGSGLGSLVTMIEMLQIDRQLMDDGRYSVSNEIVTSIVESASIVRRWLDELDAVSRGLNNQYPVSLVHPEQLQKAVHEVVEEIGGLQSIKNHSIEIESNIVFQPILCNYDVMKMVLKELFTNAFKFSPDQSTVRLVYQRTGDSISLLMINKILKYTLGISGIPHEMESRVFEPFRKLNNIHDDRFQGEMFGMGTGLTVVQAAVNQLGGKIYLYEADDPGSEIQEDRVVVAELIFPIDGAGADE